MTYTDCEAFSLLTLLGCPSRCPSKHCSKTLNIKVYIV